MFTCGICGKDSAAKEKPVLVRISKSRSGRLSRQPAEVPAHVRCALKLKVKR